MYDILQTVGVQFTIDVEQRLVIATFAGELTDAEALGLASMARSNPDFDPSFSLILDFSGVTAGTLSTSAIQEFSQRESILSPTSMHVVVAPQDHMFGAARMAQVLSRQTRPKVTVVRTLDEARKVLGLEKTA